MNFIEYISNWINENPGKATGAFAGFVLGILILSVGVLKTVFIIIIITFVAIWTVFPIYYLFLTSVKESKMLFVTPPRFVVKPTFETYHELFIEQKFYTYFINSLIIALGTVALTLVIASFATFGFTQWKFK